MAIKSNAVKSTADREIVITRLLNAPPELVWKAWTEQKHVENWWGPNGFTNTFQKFEVKVGGAWRFVMHGPDGATYPNRIVFSEVVKPERLVFLHDSDKDNDPDGFHVTVTFARQGNKTRLTMRSLFAYAEVRDKVVKEYGAIEGGNQTINKLEAYLKTM